MEAPLNKIRRNNGTYANYPNNDTMKEFCGRNVSSSLSVTKKPKISEVKKENKIMSDFEWEEIDEDEEEIDEDEEEQEESSDEEEVDDKIKWTILNHKGPVFAPDYEPLPSNVNFFYNGEVIKLSEPAEEVAGFYAKMLNNVYTSKDIFNENFLNDWRGCMTEEERAKITDLKKCDFNEMHAFFLNQSKNRTEEEKQALKEKNKAIANEYGFCNIDGRREKNYFKIEPPGLFKGRGEHPKMGKLKRRVEAEDVVINCSRDSNIPDPPTGHRWKEVRNDPRVTWLASWTDNIQNRAKYIQLHPSSTIKVEKDKQKYETARRLYSCIEEIRNNYRDDWESNDMCERQIGVALYFIDELALRAGNDKDTDQADTVGCCSLRVEHIKLHEREGDMGYREYVVVFDFHGKGYIRYNKELLVEKKVFNNLQLFMKYKDSGDKLFNLVNPRILNKHLNKLMEGLTVKVFRTFRASVTLQEHLDRLTNENGTVDEKIRSYKEANMAVAKLCNHQLSVPGSSTSETEDTFNPVSSKLSYLDPRITVAWCKKNNVPIEKIYNKSERDKFKWDIDTTGPDYRF